MRTQLHRYALAASVLAAVSFMVVCGGNSSMQPASFSSSSNNSTPPPMGSVVVLAQDSPVCNVVSFTVTIMAATLTPENNGTPVSVLKSGSQVTVDFARLMDFSTVLNLASVPQGTYSSVNLTLSNPQLVVLDVTKTPPAPTPIAATLTSSTVTVSIQPALQVSASSSSGLELDFSLRKSVETDANGQVTGAVNPVFSASPSTESTADDLGEIEELSGIVQSVATASGNPSFSGSFAVLQDDGTTVTVNLQTATTSDSEEEDNTGLNQLAAGMFVEVDAFVDSNGNLVAKSVETEEQEDENHHKSAFIGAVTSVTRDPSSGAATGFTMFVRAEQPDESFMVPTRSSVTVSLSDTTRFKVTARGLNEAGLKFDATTLGVGQEVVVHGMAQGPMAPTVAAKGVFLRLQSLIGNFSTLIPSPGGGASNNFTFVPCSPLFKGAPITVATFSNTAFAGVSGLSALTARPELVVKGLLFYEQQPVDVNGVSISSPDWVLEAKQVHKLNP